MLTELLQANLITKRASVEQDDPSKLEQITKGYLASLAGWGGAMASSGIYANTALSSAAKFHNPEAHKILTRFAAHKGAPVIDDLGSNSANFIGKHLLGPHYNPATRGHIYMGKVPNATGILAHEAGHAAQPKFFIKGRQAGRLLSSLGMIGVILGDRDTAQAGAIAGTAGMLPTLAHEIDASRRGAGLLGKLGVKGLSRLTPYAGLPTYAIAAALPTIAYKLKETFGGFSPERAWWDPKGW